MDPRSTRRCTAARRLPRASGDGPRQATLDGGSVVAAPRERGWTRRRRVRWGVYLGWLLAGTGADVNLETIFPGYPHRVFAHWYSGTLRVPRGDRLRYVHGGWLSVYERDEMLEFVSGVMRRAWVRDNTVRAGAAPAGDLAGAAMGRRSP